MGKTIGDMYNCKADAVKKDWKSIVIIFCYFFTIKNVSTFFDITILRVEDGH